MTRARWLVYFVCNESGAAAGPRVARQGLEFGAEGDVEHVTLERVLGTELLIILDDKGERLRWVGAGRKGHDRSGAVNAGLEGAEPRAGAAVAGGLNHRIADGANAKRPEILGDGALEIEDVAGFVVGRGIFEVHRIDRGAVHLPSRLGIEIGRGKSRHHGPMVKARIGELPGAVIAGRGEAEYADIPMEIAGVPAEHKGGEGRVA